MQLETPRWAEISEVTEAGVKLLRFLGARAIRQHDRQHALGEFSGLTTTAAAAALQNGKTSAHALELLETGRGIIMGLRLETEIDVVELRKKDASLADRFLHLRDQLNADTSLLKAFASVGQRAVVGRWSRHNLEHEFNQVINEINHLADFKDFHQPAKAGDFIQAAAYGPIAIINISPIRCDAIVVTKNGILEPVRLSDQLYSKLADAAKRHDSIHSSSTLQLLWDSIAVHVLDRLAFNPITSSDEPCPRLWWVPTGVLTRFPLHAAGYHSPGSSQTVIDRVVSSYTPSLRALLHARHRAQRDGGSGDGVLVSMSSTPGISAMGLQDLQKTEYEVGIVSRLMPETMQKRYLPGTTKEKVMVAIEKCSIFHFAGHGRSHPWDPSRSCLLLADWKTDPLTVLELNNLQLYKNPPWLAYLSACSTGESQADHLLDEGIHLVSACQLAGFQHVIGSLWTIDDEYSVDAAREVYTTIRQLGWNNAAVARGLWNASRMLRDKLRVRYPTRLRDIKVDETNRESSEEESNGVGEKDARGSGKAMWRDYEAFIWAAYFHVGP